MKSPFFVLLLAAALLGCDEGVTVKPEAAGAQGEVLVVMDTTYWNGDAGVAARGVLEQYFPRLPQREPHFRVAQCTPKQFGGFLRNHRNVLLAEIGPGQDSVVVQRQPDRYARGQVVLRVAAPNTGLWVKALQDRAGQVLSAFDDAERERLQERLARESDQALGTSLLSQLQVEMNVPGGFRVAKQAPHFVWLRRDRIMSGAGLEHNVQEGLLVYTYPYVSDSTFLLKPLVDMRDSVLKLHVPGPDPNTWMITQRRFEEVDLMPLAQDREVDGAYAKELRGLWGMHGMLMGGPFISLTRVDEARGRVVTAEGYVYAPQFDKREYLREMEAVIYGLRFPEAATP